MLIIYSVPNLFLLGLGALSVPWETMETMSLGLIRWWLLIPVVIILILYNIFIALFRQYSYCFAVLENQTGWQAIKSGFDLLKKDFGNILVVGLIYIGLSMAATLAMVVIILAICVPFFLLFMIALFLGKWMMIIVIILWVIVGLVCFLALRGAIGTYFQSYFTHAYWELKK